MQEMNSILKLIHKQTNKQNHVKMLSVNHSILLCLSPNHPLIKHGMFKQAPYPGIFLQDKKSPKGKSMIKVLNKCLAKPPSIIVKMVCSKCRNPFSATLLGSVRGEKAS